VLGDTDLLKVERIKIRDAQVLWILEAARLTLEGNMTACYKGKLFALVSTGHQTIRIQRLILNDWAFNLITACYFYNIKLLERNPFETSR